MLTGSLLKPVCTEHREGGQTGFHLNEQRNMFLLKQYSKFAAFFQRICGNKNVTYNFYIVHKSDLVHESYNIY